VFAVPADAVAQSARAYAARSPAAKLGSGPLRALSGGRLLRRAYPPGADPGICDSLIPQQGPNYALAKRVHRWRATVARDEGADVSMNVAPPTRTRSVLKNRALAAAYIGAPRFGVEVFEPATTKTLMAALLVHDLQAGAPEQAHPWQDEANAAAHGGLWRIAYAPRSALGLAALIGYSAARNGTRLARPLQKGPSPTMNGLKRSGQLASLPLARRLSVVPAERRGEGMRRGVAGPVGDLGDGQLAGPQVVAGEGHPPVGEVLHWRLAE
jgi:hypothetical protein